MKKAENIVYRLTFALAIIQLVVIVGSWLVTAAMPDLTRRSLLSSAGIRWYFGMFTRNMASPLLVWMILATLAGGCLVRGGLLKALADCLKRRPLTSQQLFSLRSTLLVLLTQLVCIGLLTLLPHAILLSVTGSLFPSSFSASLVPCLFFIVALCSVVYGVLSGNLRSIVEVGQSLCAGGPVLMPLLLLYVIGKQLFASIVYIFSL
jgi:p-aminobenzoyl-glutamate transporter AbgT